MTAMDMRRDRRFYPYTPTQRALRSLKAQRKAGTPFEPVAVPTYRPRPHTVLARYWRAVGPSLIGLGLFIFIAATAAGWIAVVAS